MSKFYAQSILQKKQINSTNKTLSYAEYDRLSEIRYLLLTRIFYEYIHIKDLVTDVYWPNIQKFITTGILLFVLCTDGYYYRVLHTESSLISIT
jgi:hypothetical protein